MTGIELIAQEREEQIKKHQRSTHWDALSNKQNELIEAAGWLLETNPAFLRGILDCMDIITPTGWEHNTFKKMLMKPYKERLIIAGALIAAEIDRLQYE